MLEVPDPNKASILLTSYLGQTIFSPGNKGTSVVFTLKFVQKQIKILDIAITVLLSLSTLGVVPQHIKT